MSGESGTAARGLSNRAGSALSSGAIVFAVYLAGSLAVQVWAWRRLLARVRRGETTRSRGALQYAGWAFLPLVLFIAGFALMIGMEEWFSLALIPERAALLVIPVFALSVLGTILFAIRSAFPRPARRKPS